VKCTRNGCEGEIVVKKSKRGKAFYGCAAYPKCDVVFWDKPIIQACPTCKLPFVLEKTTKKDGTFQYCSSETCDYTTGPVPRSKLKSEEKTGVKTVVAKTKKTKK
jgi:DNA topoisomerase-1